MSNMAAEVMDSLGAKSNGSVMATPHVHNNQVGQPQPHMPPPSANMTRNTTARENTTLIANESEAFALLPIDVPATVEPRR